MKNSDVTTVRALLEVACGAATVALVVLTFTIAMPLRSVEAQNWLLV